jgi:hypothetical protein
MNLPRELPLEDYPTIQLLFAEAAFDGMLQTAGR